MTVTYGLYKHRQRISFTHKHENREGREGLITPMKKTYKPGYIYIKESDPIKEDRIILKIVII
jgi:hypothetical protein